MSAQSEGVFVAGGQLADAEKTHQGFQLVGQGEHGAGVVARQTVASKAGLVVVFDGDGHAVAQALVAGVVATHHALQFGELAHHVGQQVGFGQLSRLLHLAVQHIELVSGINRVRQGGVAQLVDDGMGNGAHALGPVALAAQAAVVDHFGQARHALGQGLLAVLVKEELGVRKARAHHTFIALDHRGGVFGRDVADHQEMPCQLALGIQKREVLLVRLHGEDQAFLGHGQELFLKGASQHIGALHQRRHFVQQSVVGNGLELQLGASGVELGANGFTPFVERGHHGTLRAQGFGVSVSVRQLNDRLLRLEAMPAGTAPCLQAEQLHRHQLAAVERNEPVRGAHKVDIGPTVGQLVAHHLRDRQGLEHVLQGGLQALGQAGARLHRVGEQGFRLSIQSALQRRIGGQTTGRQLLQQSRGGLTARVQAHGHRHELDANSALRRLGAHTLKVQAKAAGRGECGQRAISNELLALERGMDQGRKAFAQLSQRLGRQFFNEQFNQQVLGLHAAFLLFFASIWATTSSAHAFGAIGKPKRARLSR